MQDDGNPAFHVCNSGPVQDFVFQPTLLLKAVILRENRVHMAGQQDPAVCLRADP